MFDRFLKNPINFVGRIKTYLIISCAVFLVGIIVQAFFGIELSIEYKGGTIIHYSFEGELDAKDADAAIQDAIGMPVKTDISTDITRQNRFLVVSLVENKALGMDTISEITSALTEKFPDSNIKNEDQSSVSPSIGAAFLAKSVFVVFLAMVCVIVYVGIRFRKIGGTSAGVMAMVALIHDMIAVYFVFVIFRIPIDDNFIAVLLTILGYSLNDTIVIYDRIREDQQKYGAKMSIRELTNNSINRTLGRTLNTAFATFFAIITVLVVAYVCGLSSIISFALPMSIGVISGSYSTICIAGPLWVAWKEYRAGKTPKSKKGAPARKPQKAR